MALLSRLVLLLKSTRMKQVVEPGFRKFARGQIAARLSQP
jgi:hypothetical protein